MGRRDDGWSEYAQTIGAALLGVVFLVAAVSKVWSPDDFATFTDQIRQEELDFLFKAPQVALIAIALQVGLGMALLLGVRHFGVLVPTWGLVLFFLFLTGQRYWFASQESLESDSCGCFGSFFERTPAEAFWQDLFLLVPLAVISSWRRSKSERIPAVRLCLALLGALGVTSWASISHDNELIELTSRLGSLGETGRFLPSHGYSLKIDGQTDEQARVYESVAGNAFLVQFPGWQDPLLIDLPSKTVRRIDPNFVRTISGDALELINQPQKSEETPFNAGDIGIRFEAYGRTYTFIRSSW